MLRKLIIISAIALSANTGLATNNLPSTLKCTAVKAKHLVDTFTIERLDTDEPGTSIYDTGSGNKDTDHTHVKLSFSNECDNSYSVTFFKDDLESLAAKKVKNVTGLMNYYNADFMDDTEGNIQAATVVITCR